MMSQSEIRLLEMKLSKAERSNDKLCSALTELADASRSYIEHMDADDIAVLERARAAIAAAKGGAA